MTFSVANLWRHPIKSHGREQVACALLATHRPFPFDRRWGVTHKSTAPEAAEGQWVPCRNFMIGTRTPSLAGIWAEFDEAANNITLQHQDIGSVSFNPDDESDVERFIQWVIPLYDAQRTKPVSIVSLPQRAWTDTDFPSISIMTSASHDAVQHATGINVAPERWRGNIWIDGTSPWEELEWIGKTLRIGGAELAIREPIVRCPHTQANPQTGIRDLDTLGTLDKLLGERVFGVYAEVIKTGQISAGDCVEVLQ
ncbi:MOSC domain-containing protein [Pelagovum sp. HNIBRBA483]|uniref:MOSC domain-containing protein n=1 Tax=Pelagovum sp. HNIBRBA483 TaxID=3233341 RepID=UPI0034A124C9